MNYEQEMEQKRNNTKWKRNKKDSPRHDQSLVFTHTRHIRSASKRHAQHSHAHIQTDDWQSERSRRGRRDGSWTKSVKKSERTRKEREWENEREREREIKRRKKTPTVFYRTVSLSHTCAALRLVERFSSFEFFSVLAIVEKRKAMENEWQRGGRIKAWNKQEKKKKGVEEWEKKEECGVTRTATSLSVVPLLLVRSAYTGCVKLTHEISSLLLPNHYRQAPPTRPSFIVQSPFSISPPAFSFFPFDVSWNLKGVQDHG